MFGGPSEFVKVFWGTAYLTSLLGSFAIEAASEQINKIKGE
jgi:hypothetical protein